MAAVLCQGICLGCKGCCDGLSVVATAPCRLCGMCCKRCGSCCQELCRTLSGCCQTISQGFGHCCSHSLCLYLTVTLGLNLPPIVVGVMDIPNYLSGPCQEMASLWLLLCWIFCVIHIVAAFYMSVMVQRTKGVFQGGESGPSRVKNLLCYDPVMAFYILIVLGFFAWSIVGIVWLTDGTIVIEDENDLEDLSDECDDGGIGQKVLVAFGFGWAFLLVGGCALSMSLCCSVFQRPTNR